MDITHFDTGDTTTAYSVHDTDTHAEYTDPWNSPRRSPNLFGGDGDGDGDDGVGGGDDGGGGGDGDGGGDGGRGDLDENTLQKLNASLKVFFSLYLSQLCLYVCRVD